MKPLHPGPSCAITRTTSRILAWDLFNEPDNSNKPCLRRAGAQANKFDLAVMLLKKTYAMGARGQSLPTPHASAPYGWGTGEIRAQLYRHGKNPHARNRSDIITFHNYDAIDGMMQCVEHLERYHRPIICSEYMARPRGSTFKPILRYLREHKVGAINWGFVNGKTQTIYPWDSWDKPYDQEPAVWFHDIFRADGTPVRSQGSGLH